jgi:rhodanese-related sulfurtransferase
MTTALAGLSATDPQQLALLNKAVADLNLAKAALLSQNSDLALQNLVQAYNGLNALARLNPTLIGVDLRLDMARSIGAAGYLWDPANTPAPATPMASRIQLEAGSPQSAPISTLFGTALKVKIVTAANLAVPNAVVRFNLPAGGASASFAGGQTTAQVIADNQGFAEAPPLWANDVVGTYQAIVSVPGLATTTSFALTNNAIAATAFKGVTAHGTGIVSATVSGGGPSCVFNPLVTALLPAAGTVPSVAQIEFPHGVFRFELITCSQGSTVTVNVTWPDLTGVGGYIKYGPTAATQGRSTWYQPTNLRTAGNTVSYTVTDGGPGDDDLTANGVIRDPNGPFFGNPLALMGGGADDVQPVPGLTGGLQWFLACLIAFIARARLRPFKKSGRSFRQWAATLALCFTGIAGADESCTRDQVPQIQAKLRDDQKPILGLLSITNDENCSITLPQARAREKQLDFVWLDVRPYDQVQRNPLLNSTVVPLNDVKDRAGLRQQEIVLVGTGWDQNSLMRACLDLRAAGFSRVRTLTGGARAWALAGKHVGGTVPLGTADIAPSDFVRSIGGAAWHVATVDLTPQALAQLPIRPDSVWRTDGAKLPAALNVWLEAASRAKDARMLLVIAPDTASQDKLQAQLDRLTTSPLAQAPTVGVPVIGLAGGATALTAYLSTQDRIRVSAPQSLTRTCRN